MRAMDARRQTRTQRQQPRGNCYAAAEALYHILGGKAAGLVPQVLRLPNGETHWYLRAYARGPVIDPSRLQFPPDRLPNYNQGRGCGFLTKQPSKRAQALILALTWQEAQQHGS